MELADSPAPDAQNRHQGPFLAVARPRRGTPRFRRNCWVGVIDGVPVANDKKNRRYEFPLDDGSDLWPRSHRPLFGTAAPWEHHFIDGRGESVIAILDVVRWHEVIAVGEAAGLVLDTKQIAPALRADGVRLQDSSWAEMGYIRLALATCSRKTLVWSAEGG